VSITVKTVNELITLNSLEEFPHTVTVREYCPATGTDTSEEVNTSGLVLSTINIEG
jgi:hypothetical protein